MLKQYENLKHLVKKAQNTEKVVSQKHMEENMKNKVKQDLSAFTQNF